METNEQELKRLDGEVWRGDVGAMLGLVTIQDGRPVVYCHTLRGWEWARPDEKQAVLAAWALHERARAEREDAAHAALLADVNAAARLAGDGRDIVTVVKALLGRLERAKAERDAERAVRKALDAYREHSFSKEWQAVEDAEAALRALGVEP